MSSEEIEEMLNNLANAIAQEEMIIRANEAQSGAAETARQCREMEQLRKNP